MRAIPFLEPLTRRIEDAESLDGAAGAIQSVVRRLIPRGPAEDVLSGVPTGHPVHPAAVAIPIGAWMSAGFLDLLGNREGARQLTALGVLTALPASATGATDWLFTEGAERRIGLVHAASNYLAIGAFGCSWWARSRDHELAGVTISTFGLTALGLAGWLGGHLTYAQGVGVDTTAFAQAPTDWTTVAAVGELSTTEPQVVDAAGIPVLVSRRGQDWRAIADRCTHRGAPLHEGKVVDDCIVCPWHDSVFSLEDGVVRSGPATRPQPVFETRVADGQLQLRRVESRSLRTNPTGT